MADWRDVKGVEEIELKDKSVFLRVDFNVPIKEGKVKDASRIEAALDTLKYIISKGAKVAVCSHLGRPDGEKKPEYSMAPVAEVLQKLLGQEVHFIDDCIGYAVKRQFKELPFGGVLLLENVRFYAGEEENDAEFATQLADGYDVYVNDAFGTAHRAHASTYGVPERIAVKAAGYLMKREIEMLGSLLKAPDRPFVAILGGAKVSDKLGVIKSLVQKADKLIIGGAMANTFLTAQGKKLGKSLVEDDQIETASKILKDAKEKKVEILLPSDFIAAENLESKTGKAVLLEKVPEDLMVLDIGGETIKRFKNALSGAKTIFWNGPMGVFETDAFSAGTIELAKAVAGSGAKSVVGGGDSIAALNKAKLADKITHVSTGGGASLKFIEGKELPAVKALYPK